MPSMTLMAPTSSNTTEGGCVMTGVGSIWSRSSQGLNQAKVVLKSNMVAPSQARAGLNPDDESSHSRTVGEVAQSRHVGHRQEWSRADAALPRIGQPTMRSGDGQNPPRTAITRLSSLFELRSW